MPEVAYYSARQFRETRGGCRSLHPYDLVGPMHAVAPRDRDAEGDLVSVCGAQVIAAMPVEWPPVRGTWQCSTCEDVTRS